MGSFGSPYFSGERIGRKTPIKKEQPLIRMEEIFKGVNFKESCIGSRVTKGGAEEFESSRLILFLSLRYVLFGEKK